MTDGRAEPQGGEAALVTASQSPTPPTSTPGAPSVPASGQAGISPYPSAVSGSQPQFIEDQPGPGL